MARIGHRLAREARGLAASGQLPARSNEAVPNGTRIGKRRVGERLADARSMRAAETMLVSAGMTSAHWRVFRPQSGLTHRRSAGMRSAAFFIN